MEGAEYRRGVQDGIQRGLAMAAVVATREIPGPGGDAAAASFLEIAGARCLADVARMRNNPLDEYDADYLVCHFENLGKSAFERLLRQKAGGTAKDGESDGGRHHGRI